jgi:hypothetical protein
LRSILTLPEDASANKKRLSCSGERRTPIKECTARCAASGTLLSANDFAETTSTTSSLSRSGKLIVRQRKSVAEGCDAPESPPIVIYGRDVALDKKSHGNQTLLKLILLNLIPCREAHYDVRASLLVRKIIKQIRDWRGRFVRFNKDRNAWKNLPSKEVIALVRRTFDEEVLKRRGSIDAAIQIFLPTETAIQRFLPKEIDGKGMDKDQIEAYYQFTPAQREKFRKLCQLRVYDVEDAVNLIEIPPWLDTAAVSPIAALSPENLQNEIEGEKKGTEACSWVEALMLATQSSEESLLSRSICDDDNNPLPDPISARRHLWAEDLGLPKSDSQHALVQRPNFRKLCRLHDVEDAVTLIDIPPWTHTALVSPIAALSPETFQKENEGENKRRKTSRNTAGPVPARQDAHEVSYKVSGKSRVCTEACSWVDALMLARQDSEESLLLRLTTDDDNTPLPDPISARRRLWGEDL